MRIGIDLGGTTVKAALCTEDGTLLCKDSLPTRTGNAAGLKADMKTLALSLCRAHSCAVEDVTAIGIGVPGSFDKKTCTLRFGTNLGLNNVSFADAFLPEFGCPVHLDNDANCAALGEAKAGAGKGVNSFVAITLGTGVGSGIVIDGKLVTGVNDAAGEMGHMVIVSDGEACTCGRRGCWESYSSATALIRQTKDAMRHDPYTAMWDLVGNNISRVNGRTSFDAMRAGDETAKKVVNQYIFYLATGITNVVNALQPDMICIGGGIGHEKENLLVPLRKMVERERYSIHAKVQTQIISAELGNDAGLIGAALLDR